MVAAEEMVPGHRDCADEKDADQPHQHGYKGGHNFQQLFPRQYFVAEAVVKQSQIYGPPGHQGVHRRPQQPGAHQIPHFSGFIPVPRGREEIGETGEVDGAKSHGEDDGPTDAGKIGLA